MGRAMGMRTEGTAMVEEVDTSEGRMVQTEVAVTSLPSTYSSVQSMHRQVSLTCVRP